MPFLESWVAKSSDDWDEVSEFLKLLFDLLGNSLGLGKFVLLKSQSEFVGSSKHLFKVGLDIVWDQFFKLTLDPGLLLLCVLHLQVPKLLIGLYLDLQFINDGVFADHEVEILLLVVNML